MGLCCLIIALKEKNHIFLTESNCSPFIKEDSLR